MGYKIESSSYETHETIGDILIENHVIVNCEFRDPKRSYWYYSVDELSQEVIELIEINEGAVIRNT